MGRVKELLWDDTIEQFDDADYCQMYPEELEAYEQYEAMIEYESVQHEDYWRYCLSPMQEER